MAPRIERKLAAILAADVVGYSRLVEADEAGTIARLKALRKESIEPLIDEHHGRVVKLMGDGALVEFASAIDAVECAVAIQKGVAEREAGEHENRRIAFRIGINVGDIIVEDGDILGDGVNVAARLEQLAEAGGVLVSGTAYDQLKGKPGPPLEFAGDRRLKNMAEPVRAYRVLTEADATSTVVGHAAVGGRRPAGWQRLTMTAVVALILIGVGIMGWLRPWQGSAQMAEGTLDTRRVAVLPFANISADAADEYFSDGLTEELISQLSKIGNLRVIARTSIMKYKGTNQDVAEIGRALQVGTILEGSVRKVGNQVRVAAQLIDVVSQAHLWSEDYDRALEDIFGIQSDIAKQVAEALQITLLVDEQVRINQQNTTSGWSCLREEQGVLRAGDRAGSNICRGVRSSLGAVQQAAMVHASTGGARRS